MHIIEFQKWVLSHIHFLLFFDQNGKIRNPTNVDKNVFTEFSIKDLLLVDIIITYMIYSPCRPWNIQALCMKDRICKKRYLKDYWKVTSMDVDGYLQYHRKNDRRTFNVGNHVVKNQDVPYNPSLNRKYNCYINIKVYASICSLKYIHKYNYKRHDCTTIKIRNE